MTTDLAWQLLCTALVLFMTPGLAFFYGGLVKSKSVVSMMMLSFGSLGLITLLWVLYGFSGIGTISESGITNFFGNPFQDFGLTSAFSDLVTEFDDGTPVEESTNFFGGLAFGGSFAIITVALISGSIADRAKFWPWLLFAGIWATVVYFPGQAWVWALNADGDYIGWIGKWGALDWAGGTIVHQAAGAAALALALVLGQRKVGFSKEETAAHNVPLVLIGTAILWFGWFGFNTGVPGTTQGQTTLIFLNTLIAPAAGLIGWIIVEKFKDGKSTAVGAASGVVAGLVAITPACAHIAPIWAILLGLLVGVVCCLAVELKWKLGFDDTLDVVGIHLVAGLVAITPACAHIAPIWAILLGLLVGVVCCLAVELKWKLGFDDTLDVVGIHLVAGFIGCIYLGFFAQVGGTGLFFGGGFDQLIKQLGSSLAVIAFAFIVAYVVGMAIEKTIGFRAKEEDEVAGIDLAIHEPGYQEVG